MIDCATRLSNRTGMQLRVAMALAALMLLAGTCMTLAQPAYAATVGASAQEALQVGTASTTAYDVDFGVTGQLSGDGTLTLAPKSGVSGDICIGFGWESWQAAADSSEQAPWYADRKKIKKVVIKPGITQIGSYAFDQCENLDSVSIPSSVKTIGEGAFFGCILSTVEIPNGVARIGNFAFHGCEFASVTIPASVTSIGADAFAVIGLKTITFKGDAPAYSADDNELMPMAYNQPFEASSAIAYYPAGNSSWTAAAKASLAGDAPIRWRSVNADGSANKVALSGCSLALSTKKYAYSGKAKTPAVTLKDGNYTLQKGVDYTLSYSGNKAVGKAKVTATGKGDYSGKKTAKFTISKAKNTLVVKAAAKKFTVKYSKTANRTIQNAKAFKISKAKGAVTFKKISGNKKITVSKAGKLTVKKGLKKGTYTVKVKVTATGNASYLKGSKNVTLKVKVA